MTSGLNNVEYEREIGGPFTPASFRFPRKLGATDVYTQRRALRSLLVVVVWRLRTVLLRCTSVSHRGSPWSLATPAPHPRSSEAELANNIKENGVGLLAGLTPRSRIQHLGTLPNRLRATFRLRMLSRRYSQRSAMIPKGLKDHHIQFIQCLSFEFPDSGIGDRTC